MSNIQVELDGRDITADVIGIHLRRPGRRYLPVLPGSDGAGTKTVLIRPENAAKPRWVRRAVSAAGNAATGVSRGAWVAAEALVLSDNGSRPLRGTLRGKAITAGYLGMTAAVSTAIVL